MAIRMELSEEVLPVEVIKTIEQGIIRDGVEITCERLNEGESYLRKAFRSMMETSLGMKLDHQEFSATHFGNISLVSLDSGIPVVGIELVASMHPHKIAFIRASHRAALTRRELVEKAYELSDEGFFRYLGMFLTAPDEEFHRLGAVDDYNPPTKSGRALQYLKLWTQAT